MNYSKKIMYSLFLAFVLSQELAGTPSVNSPQQQVDSMNYSGCNRIQVRGAVKRFIAKIRPYKENEALLCAIGYVGVLLLFVNAYNGIPGGKQSVNIP